MFIGKFTAGLFGLMLGSALGIGLFGLIFGLWVGHQFDQALKQKLAHFKFFHQPFQQKSGQYHHFFMVLGHISKADGYVSKNEIEIARTLMDRLGLTDDDARTQAKKAFNDGKKTHFRLQPSIQAIQFACLLNPQLKAIFIQSIMALEQSDTSLHPYKKRIIDFVLGQLHFSQQHRPFGHQQQTAKHDDYVLLDVPSDVSKTTLKQAYRRQMHRHHPDRLVAKGASDAAIRQATEKTQAIKAAYERICQAKGY